jgi:ribosomal protein L7Ae-like RNA K-turn-binding protein
MSMLGIAAKGRNVVSGSFAVEKAVKTGKAYLVIVSAEASDNTKKMFTNMCTFYEVPIVFYGMKEELGRAIGQQMRANLAVTDSGLANSILKLLETVK